MKKILLISFIVFLMSFGVVSSIECNSDLSAWDSGACHITQNLVLNGGNLVANGTIYLDEAVVFDGNGADITTLVNSFIVTTGNNKDGMTIKNFKFTSSSVSKCIDMQGDNTKLYIEGVDVTCTQYGFTKTAGVWNDDWVYLKDSNFTSTGSSSSYKGIDGNLVWLDVDNVRSLSGTVGMYSRLLVGNDLYSEATDGTYSSYEGIGAINITRFDSAGDNVKLSGVVGNTTFVDSSFRDFDIGFFYSGLNGLIEGSTGRWLQLHGGEKLLEVKNSTFSRLRMFQDGTREHNLKYSFTNGEFTDLDILAGISQDSFIDFYNADTSVKYNYKGSSAFLESNIGSALEIGNNYVWAETGNPNFDRPATITFDNLLSSPSEYIVSKDGVEAIEGVDFNISFSDIDTLSIDVGGFSNWSIAVWDGFCDGSFSRIPCIMNDNITLTSDVYIDGADVSAGGLGYAIAPVGNSVLTLDGAGHTLYRNSSTNSRVIQLVHDGIDFTIKNLTFENLGTNNEVFLSTAGFYVNSNNALRLIDNNFKCYNEFGKDYCIYIGSNYGTDLKVFNNTFMSSIGLFTINSRVRNVEIVGNTFYGGAFRDSTAQGNSDFLFEGNDVYPLGSGQDVINIKNDKNPVIKNNNFYRNSTHKNRQDILASGTGDYSVEGNYFTSKVFFNGVGGSVEMFNNTFNNTGVDDGLVTVSYLSNYVGYDSNMYDNIFLGDNYFRLRAYSGNSFYYDLSDTQDTPKFLFNDNVNYSVFSLSSGLSNIVYDDSNFYFPSSYDNFSSYASWNDNVIMGSNYVYVNPLGNFNKPASVVFSDVNDPLMIAYKDGVECGASCLNFVNDGVNISFDVLVGGNYSYDFVPNIPPVIVEVVPQSNPSLPFGREQTFSANVFDADNGTISYLWYLDGNLTSETSSVFVYTSAFENAGIHELELIVTDGEDEDSYLWYVEDLAKYNNQYVAEDVAKVGIDWITSLLIFFGGLVGVAGAYLVFAYFTGRKPFDKMGGMN